jgi:hypothetical protein
MAAETPCVRYFATRFRRRHMTPQRTLYALADVLSHVSDLASAIGVELTDTRWDEASEQLDRASQVLRSTREASGDVPASLSSGPAIGAAGRRDVGDGAGAGLDPVQAFHRRRRFRRDE